MNFNISEKNILITGGAGFLVKFVVDKLRERGCYRNSMEMDAGEQ